MIAPGWKVSSVTRKTSGVPSLDAAAVLEQEQGGEEGKEHSDTGESRFNKKEGLVYYLKSQTSLHGTKNNFPALKIEKGPGGTGSLKNPLCSPVLPCISGPQAYLAI